MPIANCAPAPYTRRTYSAVGDVPYMYDFPVTDNRSPSTNVKFGSATAPVVVPSLVNILCTNGSATASNPVPEVPDVPSSPDVPELPLVPVVPDVPSTPDVPDVPVVPEVPSTPDVPDVPEVPVVPDVPVFPEVPDVPSPPEAPSKFTVHGPVPLPLPYPFTMVAVIAPVMLSYPVTIASI